MSWPPPFEHAWDSLGNFLRGLYAASGVRPRAVLVVSAHWEAAQPTVTARVDPPLIYDYSHFPASTYALKYPAPGSPALANRVIELLTGAGIAAASDPERGFDHGVFVPFLLIAPEASVPIVQLSLVTGLDPERHLAIGRALGPLRDEDVLIVGSGMSYHNLDALRSGTRSEGATEFDAWLSATASAAPSLRSSRLRTWEQAPAARLVHPEEDHLLPLMVAVGAAETAPGRQIFHDRVMGAPLAAFQFG
jgi:aromatic ring-opening dioxygenase catalytic subunit (LigB family)